MHEWSTEILWLQGYVSIGCEPCTRPVLPGQHEREGRWWWEDAKAKECGLHKVVCTRKLILLEDVLNFFCWLTLPCSLMLMLCCERGSTLQVGIERMPVLTAWCSGIYCRVISIIWSTTVLLRRRLNLLICSLVKMWLLWTEVILHHWQSLKIAQSPRWWCCMLLGAHSVRWAHVPLFSMSNMQYSWTWRYFKRILGWIIELLNVEKIERW